MILGLDVSTSITGATILDKDNIVLCEAWDTRKLKTVFEKAEFPFWQVLNLLKFH